MNNSQLSHPHHLTVSLPFRSWAFAQLVWVT